MQVWSRLTARRPRRAEVMRALTPRRWSSSRRARASRTRASGRSSMRSRARSRTRARRRSAQGAACARRQWLARWARTTPSSRAISSWRRGGPGGELLEKAARRALAANALCEAVRSPRKSLAFAEDKPTQFARAQILDEAWNRLDARAGERDTAVRAMQDSIHDEASEVRALGARVRYEDASGGGPDTRRACKTSIRRAKVAGLFDEEARSAAALASRLASPASSIRGRRRRLPPRAVPRARHSRRGRRRMADARRGTASGGDVGAALEARRSAARAAAAAGLKTREATLTINVGFALTTMGGQGRGARGHRGRHRAPQAVGSPGTVRHGQMILLCWVSTFDPRRRSMRCSPIRAPSPTTPSPAPGSARSRDARRPLLSRRRSCS